MKQWLWPVSIIVTVLIVSLTALWLEIPVLQPLSVAAFLLLCPGMAVMGFLRLHDLVQTLTLACALSLALDAIVASALLYGGIWSPQLVLALLLGASAYGACVRLAISLREALHAQPTRGV